MSSIKFVKWDAKPRTMLRFIKAGDIFCFKRNDGKYSFGRIMAKCSMGHFVELFSYAAEIPSISEDQINQAKRLLGPFCLNSYTIFDTKRFGDWRIIGHDAGYHLEGGEAYCFAYGGSNNFKKVDMLGNTEKISNAEAGKYPRYRAYDDMNIQKMLDELCPPGPQ